MNLFNRRNFLKGVGMTSLFGAFGMDFFHGVSASESFNNELPASTVYEFTNGNIKISTNFVNGGGVVKLIDSNPLTIRFQPHDEGKGGWSKVWFHFLIEGIVPGQEVKLELELGHPRAQGISPQLCFSYDQEIWGLTDKGQVADNDEFFVYTHTVRNDSVWFAYDFPYNHSHVDNILLPSISSDKDVEIIELCRSKRGRPLRAIRLNHNHEKKKYGIWLQARAHAFESGTSWVVHYLTLWLLSSNPLAIALRNCADITIVPIIDIDGVAEGRTGKYGYPYDHGQLWFEDEHHWPEVNSLKAMVNERAKENLMDLFIDFHGPGKLSHPYFIVPYETDLPYVEQRENRSAFFKVLKAQPLDRIAEKTQSMTLIHYSERLKEQFHPRKMGTAPHWVTYSTNNHVIALAHEVNMNTPLSTLEGYKAQAQVFGEAIARYFSNDLHSKG